MRSLTYTNPLGTSVTLYQSPFLITKLDGLEMATIDQQQQKAPYQDGVTWLDALFEPRTVVVEGTDISTQALGAIWADRASIHAALNPKLGIGTLILTTDIGTYTTPCATAVVQFPSKDSTTPFQSFHFEFFCPDPYWYANSSGSVVMTIVSGGMTFPFTFPFTFGTYTGNTPVTVSNLGDSETPVVITVNGPSENPVITNTTTGELMKFNITLAGGESLIINTKFGSKSVYKNSGTVITNQSGTIDATSTFWQLAVGDNVITFLDELNNTATQCTVAWFNRYSGR